MPYGGEENAEQVRKIESCVQNVMAKQNVEKSRAIAICKSQILNPSKRRTKREEGK